MGDRRAPGAIAPHGAMVIRLQRCDCNCKRGENPPFRMVFTTLLVHLNRRRRCLRRYLISTASRGDVVRERIGSRLDTGQ